MVTKTRTRRRKLTVTALTPGGEARPLQPVPVAALHVEPPSGVCVYCVYLRSLVDSVLITLQHLFGGVSAYRNINLSSGVGLST
ncbi:hypothetical protein RRG08_066229 [Elysia crispata]|uniref:Uncharacterized protein n=1 Tax=Elysia crispata TaxID=231223 RepID=A0AAE1BCW9_9GAST|nr:hypothetical protein RRG08_066229 [Elysia crispata]